MAHETAIVTDLLQVSCDWNDTVGWAPIKFSSANEKRYTLAVRGNWIREVTVKCLALAEIVARSRVVFLRLERVGASDVATVQ